MRTGFGTNCCGVPTSHGDVVEGEVAGHWSPYGCITAVKKVETRVGRTEDQEQNVKRVNLISFFGFYFTLKGSAG